MTRSPCLVGLFALLIVPPIALAQSTKPNEARSVDNPPRSDRGEPEVGPVRPASSLLGQNVQTKDGQRAGQVVDLALDLDEGYVAALLISDDDSSQATRTVIPWDLAQLGPRGEPVRLKVSQSELQRAPQLKTGQKLDEATRLWLATVYQHFKLEPYWHQRQQASTWGKAGEYGKLFNPKSIVDLEGRVTDITYLAPLPGMAVGTQLTLGTDNGVVKVQLGPLSHLSEQEFRIEKDAKVKVRGSEIMLAGNPVVMAISVQSGEQRLRLRQPDGTVHWREWSKQDDSYAPVSLKGLLGTPIRNNEDRDLGKLADFAVSTKQGVLAYAALTCTCFDNAADKLFPVPLSAFVVRPQSRAWLLELPLEVLENTQAFPVRQWPETIDRGWVEYVHVRYGRSPFGGVRTQPHGETPKN